MVDQKRLIALTRKLVSIDSQNPPGDERKIGDFVKGFLERLGIKARIYEFRKGRANVIAVIKGKNSRRSLLITPHLDTVPAGKSWTVDPFKGAVRSGKLYGLGATDCKSNLACAMEAIRSIVEDKAQLDYDLIFAATADEETGSDLGLIPLLEKGILKPTEAVVLDSDDFDIIVTQKGLMHMKVKVEGKRAHGAYPWRGKNAIDASISAIREIQSLRHKFKKSRHLRPPTVNLGTIRGGDKVNVVADWCEFELDFRFLPGSSAQDILKKVKGILKKHAGDHKIEIQGIQEPYSIAETHALVESLKKCMRAAGARPQVKGSEGATVITFFQHKHIPAVATGFGSGGCAHTADEYVKVANLYRGALALEAFLRNYKF